MGVKVRYIGMVEHKLGKKEDCFELTNPIKIEELIEIIINKYGGGCRNVFYNRYENNGSLNVFFIKNKKFADKNEDISDGDELTILPIIAGG